MAKEMTCKEWRAAQIARVHEIRDEIADLRDEIREAAAAGDIDAQENAELFIRLVRLVREERAAIKTAVASLRK